MKKKYLFIFVLILTLGGVLSYQQDTLSSSMTAPETVTTGTEIGQKAPDFTLTLLNDDKLQLADLKGKKVFLNFWATWCPPCRSELPDIQKLYQNHKDIAVLGIDIQEKRGTVAEYMMVNGYTYPVALDKTGKVAAKYLVRGIPTTYTLDENGIIIKKHTGALNYQQMLKLMGLKD